jgi:hypothetical protein
VAARKSGKASDSVLAPPPGPYDPLDRINIALSIEGELLRRPVVPLSSVDDIQGAGIYAIYYTGDVGIYKPLRNNNGEFKTPIYVGKAIPKGGRKGGLKAGSAKSNALAERLRQHATSVREVGDLELADFQVRALPVQDIWIPLGENVLIERFKPAWNVAVDGFGNKDPGKRRKSQFRSPWDVLHAGRKFADKLGVSPVTAEFMRQRVSDYLAGRQMRKLPKAVVEEQAVEEAIDELVSDEEV